MSIISNDNAKFDNKYGKKALVIAVSDYDKFSGLKSIEFCKNDGEEMYNVLKKNGYDIPDNRKLIGHVDNESLKNAIYDFFTDENNKPDDTLVFYYSGHGVPDNFGGTFLAPSDINSARPFKAGFSFDDLTKSMLSSNSQSIVTILDSCFSGALKIGKGMGLDSKSGEEATTILANNLVEEKSEILKQGIGRCLLAASQGYEEAYDRQEKDHSIFTYYLLEGLKGHKDAVDSDGNVTYDTLGKFITKEIKKLPSEKRPKQTPVRKGEVAGGEIVLAIYPALGRKTLKDVESLISEGLQYYENNENDKARIRFDKALEINPTNAKLYNYKGDTFFNEKNYPEAIKWYDEALKLNPTYRDVLKDKGLSLRKLGRYPEAISCFDAILERYTDDVQFWEYKGFALLKLGEYDEAMKCFQKIVEIEPNNLDAWIQKANILDALKRDEDSLECHKKVLSLDPHNKYSQRKIDMLQSKAQDPYIGPTPLSADKIEKFNALMREGSALSYKNEYEQALKKFEDAMNINPNSSNPFSKKSSILIQMSEYKRALDEAHKALKIDPNNVEALFNKGYILASAGRYEQAIEWYDKMTELDFTNANAWLQKGMCYERIGNKHEAKECFKIAENLKIK